MRTAFFRTLLELAERDQRINLVVGDLGFSVVEEFAEKFPSRFVNAGVAEQNMVGLAAGMALCGKIVFVYSIANFPTFRCLEQIRNDICYHTADVKIVAVGGGFAYGSLGFSHHATEDLAIMRVLPNMTVVAPGDPVEVEGATRAIASRSGPCYLRLGRAGEPRVNDPQVKFELGKAITVRSGEDLTLISTGGMLHTNLRLAQRLADRGVDARVLSMHTLKPLDADAVRAAARQTGAIITLEEHSEIGGLGSAVAEVLADGQSTPCVLKRVAVPSVFSSVAGSQEYQRMLFGLTEDSIMATIESVVGWVEKTGIRHNA